MVQGRTGLVGLFYSGDLEDCERQQTQQIVTTFLFGGPRRLLNQPKGGAFPKLTTRLVQALLV